MEQYTECVHGKLVSSEVVSETQIAAEHFQVGLLCPYIAHNATSGQFIQVRVNRLYDPLLCRPLAIYRTKGDVFEILFKVVGKGTRLLAEKRVGDTLEIIGPLGTGFPVDREFQLAILVAGGMGIASLMALAETIGNPPKSPFKKGGLDERCFTKGGFDKKCFTKGGLDERCFTKGRFDEGRFTKGGLDEGRFPKGGFNGRQIIALIGASTQSKIIGEKELLALGAQVRIATEDGSTGHRGMVSELLEETLLREIPLNPPLRKGDLMRGALRKGNLTVASRIFACGPTPMLKAVAQIAAQYEIPAYVSLEERMACGVGACLGCACEVVSSETGGASTYKLVCVDGPVFNAQEIAWK